MNARGFTLLEVLVALAILGTAVVASIQGFAQGLRLLKLSGDHQDAMLLADQKLREVVAPTEGREEGTENRLQWTRTISRVAVPELAETARGRRWSVYEIDVHVRWDERREVQLTTLRTVSDVGTSQLGAPRPPGPRGQSASPAPQGAAAPQGPPTPQGGTVPRPVPRTGPR